MSYEENENQKAQIPKEDQEYLRKAESELPDANVSADNASTDNASTDNASNNSTSPDEEPADKTSADDGIDDQEHITGDMHPTTRTETSQEEKNAEQED